MKLQSYKKTTNNETDYCYVGTFVKFKFYISLSNNANNYLILSHLFQFLTALWRNGFIITWILHQIIMYSNVSKLVAARFTTPLLPLYSPSPPLLLYEELPNK